ncbi:hypothetical protein [Mycobacterium sp.]|uniref:hypothetical protein n=1 Tax=Mycobacterium sp. TaxID=1785 RepID=UPI00128132CB|nr:hypothetical protein [Mycobacterium sp.]KAA8969348.1 MAG: hypothetical protein F6Q13_03480 [Mycobacterium sp.]
MTLARPDIRHPRIVLAGQSGAAPADDAGLLAALRRRGLPAHWLAWDDLATLRADLVIVRAAGADRSGQFLAWTKRVRHLLNTADVLAWNTDRRYLLDLQQAGVPTTAATADATTALVFLGGAQSHAFTPQTSVEPDFQLWDIGRAALRAAAERLGFGVDRLLYARADVTDDARLVGLDLVAPILGWGQLDAASREIAERQFAVCVESALERLGFGPFSHRRP